MQPSIDYIFKHEAELIDVMRAEQDSLSEIASCNIDIDSLSFYPGMLLVGYVLFLQRGQQILATMPINIDKLTFLEGAETNDLERISKMPDNKIEITSDETLMRAEESLKKAKWNLEKEQMRNYRWQDGVYICFLEGHIKNLKAAIAEYVAKQKGGE